jgi:hypothetical protein
MLEQGPIDSTYTARTTMTDAGAPTVSALTSADEDRLQKQRELVRSYLDDASIPKFATKAGKLGTIRALLAANTFKPTQTYELQSLGVVFGDAVAEETRMKWVRVEDSDGRDPALEVPGTSLIVYPLTMISKRVEKGETVDVFALFNTLCDDVDRLRAEAR